MSPAGTPLVGALIFRSDRGREVSFENTEFAVTAGTQQIRLSNSHQRTPFAFEMTLTVGDPPSARVNYTSSVVGWSAHWLDRQQRALEIMASGCKIAFRDVTTGIEHGLGGVAPGCVDKPDARFSELARELAWVEDQIKEPIQIPGRPFFTMDDVENLAVVRQILTTGQHAVSSAAFILQAEETKREHLIKSLYTSKSQVLLTSESSTRRVLDVEVQVGPVELHARGAQVVPTLGKEETADAIRQGEPVEIELRPAKGARLFVRYPWWYKSRRR